MGNSCFPKNKSLTQSLLNDSYNFDSSTNSEILENNIKDINNRIYRIEERCGQVFTQFSNDIQYLNNALNEIKSNKNPE